MLTKLYSFLLYITSGVYERIVNHPQSLAEHGSGWLGVSLGYRILSLHNQSEIRKLLGAVVPMETWAVLLTILGIYQLLAVSFLSEKLRRLGAFAGFCVWLFMWVMFYYDPDIPLIGAVFPVFIFLCGLSYLSLTHLINEVEHRKRVITMRKRQEA